MSNTFTGPSAPDFLPGATPLRSICGFWKRIFALFIDVLIVGLFGLILGLFLSDFFERLGHWGPLLGFVISFAYFGIFNSSKGAGQTPGMRFMQIRVVDREGMTISMPRSLARYAILGAPYFLGSGTLPLSMQTTWFGLAYGSLLSGMSLAIVYLYVFNRATRQSLHDLIAGTFVVESASNGKVEAPSLWKGHLYIAAACVVVSLAGGALIPNKFMRADPFPELLAIQRAVGQMPDVASVSVTLDREIGSADSTTLIVTVRWYPAPRDEDRTVAQVAARVLATDPNAASRDFLFIRRVTGYNIGIAQRNRFRNFRSTPDQWKQKIRDASIAAHGANSSPGPMTDARLEVSRASLSY